MEELLLACDLDNTLIHSHRHRREGDVCVEWLEGREQSFLDGGALRMLPLLEGRVRLVPVTTRSLEQYRRIRWPDGCAPELAAVANGALLLREGGVEESWRRDALAAAEPFLPELERLRSLLSHAEGQHICRIVDGLFLFVSCEDESRAAQLAAAHPSPLIAAPSGRKLYFFPPGLDKGAALRRLRRELGAERVAAAGDSGLDLPMLAEAGLAIVPDAALAGRLAVPAAVCPPGESFAAFILRTALEACGDGLWGKTSADPEP